MRKTGPGLIVIYSLLPGRIRIKLNALIFLSFTKTVINLRRLHAVMFRPNHPTEDTAGCFPSIHSLPPCPEMIDNVLR